MKKMRLGMLTALCVSLSLVPMTAMAADQPSSQAENTVAQTDVLDSAKDDRPDFFSDVTKGSYYYDAVFWATEQAITSGTDQTHFSPKALTTRGQLVTFLWRSAGEPEVDQAISFKDIDNSSDLGKAIRWAVSKKLVSGYADGRFDPSRNITREQLMVILYNYAKARNLDVSVGEDTNILSYTDFDQISEYAIPAIQWAAGSGIVSAGADGKIQPKKSCSRAETVTMMYRLMGDIGTRF